MKKPDRLERLLDLNQMDEDDIRACSVPATRVLQLLRAEHQWVREMVEKEEELSGDMPDEMWEAIKNDRDATAQAMRIAVRCTKQNILTKLKARAK